MHYVKALDCSAAAVCALITASASAGTIVIDPAHVEWTHIALPPPGNQNPAINALPTTGEVRYENVTTWRRGLHESIPQAMIYFGPGNNAKLWASDDLHMTAGPTSFNEVHFVIQSYETNRPMSLSFWQSDESLSWPDPTFPATIEYSLILPESTPQDNEDKQEYYATLVTVKLPTTVDLGPDVWMGMQSLYKDGTTIGVPYSDATSAVGWSDEYWSQVPGFLQQNDPVFQPYPNNFAYGLSYARPASVCASDISDGGAAGSDGVTNVFDLLALLSEWGGGGPGATLADPSDVVNVFDLLELLSEWGPCD